MIVLLSVTIGLSAIVIFPNSSDAEESYVAGAIGPLPDADIKFIISNISTFCIIVGMIGLGIVAIYEIRNKRKSV